MNKYIERDEILQKISRMIEYCKKDNKVNGLTALFQVGDAIIDCKAADVQEVVRCKDCNYYDMQNCYCEMFDFDTPSDDFYCREGERMDGEENAKTNFRKP